MERGKCYRGWREKVLYRMERESVIGIIDNDLCVYDNVLVVNVFFVGVFIKILVGYF